MAEGDILGYGYEGSYSLFYQLPSKLGGPIEINSQWLVCKHICIPGKASIKGELLESGFVGPEKIQT